MTTKVIGKNISLYPTDWEIVAKETEPLGMKTSQGIRYIIRNWQQLKNELAELRRQSPKGL